LPELRELYEERDGEPDRRTTATNASTRTTPT
jgi:hypothetical protein